MLTKAWMISEAEEIRLRCFASNTNANGQVAIQLDTADNYAFAWFESDTSALGSITATAVIEADTIRMVDKNPQHSTAPPEIHLEIGQFVAKTFDRRLQQAGQLVGGHRKP